MSFTFKWLSVRNRDNSCVYCNVSKKAGKKKRQIGWLVNRALSPEMEANNNLRCSVEWKIQSSEKPWAILLWIVVYVCTKHDQCVSPQTSLLGLALGKIEKLYQHWVLACRLI